MAGYLPQFQHMDVAPSLTAFRAGAADGQETADRNMLRQVGSIAAEQGLEAGSKAALSSGHIGVGVSLGNLSIDRQAKLYDFLGRAAVAADTPEKWKQLTGTLGKTFGPDSVKGFEDFNSRESAILMSMSAAQQMQMRLQQQQLRNQQQAAQRAGIPANYERNPSGPGVRPIPGGPDDPEQIARVASAKNQNSPLTREQAKKDVARVETYKSEADTGRVLLSDVAQIRELRKGVGYEGGVMAPQRATVAGWFGSGGGQALQSKATEIQLGFSERTKGAITDREQAMFASATPGLSMSDAAAEIVLNGMEATGRRVVERGKFFESWMRTHKNLGGAQEAWDQFVKEKPVLEPDGKGSFKVNEKNVESWKPYVGEADKPAGGGSQRISSKAEYDKLPSGTKFVGSDGKSYQKP